MAGSLRTGQSRGEVLAVFWALVAAWVVAAAVLAGVLVADAASVDDPLTCPLPGGAVSAGAAEWSWTELGVVCTWDEPGLAGIEQGPGLARWAVAGALAGWGITVLYLGSLLLDVLPGARERTLRRQGAVAP